MDYDVKWLEYNDDAMNDMSDELIDELANFDEEPMPFGFLQEIGLISNRFERKRAEFYKKNYDSYIASKAKAASLDFDEEERDKLGSAAFNEYQNRDVDWALEFLDKYPQFKPLVKGVTYDKDMKFVRFEEIK